MHLAPFPAHQREHVLILNPVLESDQINKKVPDDFNVDAPYGRGQASCSDGDDGLLSKGMGLAG